MTHVLLDNIDYIVARERGGSAELIAPDGTIRHEPSASLPPRREWSQPVVPCGAAAVPFPARPREFLIALRAKRLAALSEVRTRARTAKTPRDPQPSSAVKQALVGVPASLQENILKALASKRKPRKAR